jgi:predicted N-acetyltransferase YhbS
MPRHTRARAAFVDVDAAVELFVRGFAFTRSFTHPYVAERLGAVWMLRDATRKNTSDYRRDEFVARGVGPAEVVRVARANTRARYAICAILGDREDDAPVRAAYTALGYRLGTTEPFFAHRLARVPRLPAPLPVRRVSTREVADRLAKAARSRQVLPEHFAPDSPLRQYVALEGTKPVGWVRSITVPLPGGRSGTWVSNMYVEPPHRRRGIGRSLLARMLRDDRAAGATMSVLLASHTGALLYPRVGYERIGVLLMYTPVRR